MEIGTSVFRAGHASRSDWETLTDTCLDQMGELAPGTNLGFVYATDVLDDDYGSIVTRLRERTGVENWVGTIGFGVCAGGREYFDEPALVVMAGPFGEDDYRLIPTQKEPGADLPTDLLDWARDTNPMLGVVHADPRNAYVPAILDSMSDDTEAYFVGGLTASRGRFDQVAGDMTQGGVSGVIFSGRVGVATALTQGCSPIGPVHEITEARDNVLLALDGENSLDVFKRDIGDVLARNMERIGGYIHAALPIANVDSGDYLVRNIMGIDPHNGFLSIGERMMAGDKLMFVRRDGPAAMKDLERMLDDITGRIDTPPRAALYYSCVARGPNLFGQKSEELTAISKAIGTDVPLAGFFANGEISANRLYGYTGVLTLIM